MLPVFCYQMSAGVRDLLLNHLLALNAAREVQPYLELFTGDRGEAASGLQRQKGTALCLIGAQGLGKRDCEAVDFGRMAMKDNRDHYLVYVVDPAELTEAAARCPHPSGLLTLPLIPALVDVTFERILTDFAQNFLQRGEEDDALIIPFGHLRRRLTLSGIDYLIASNKKLEIAWRGQSFSCRLALDKLAETLGEDFFRCHRSCLVRKTLIHSVDPVRMEIALLDGTRLPLSRANRGAAMELLEAQHE